MHILVVTYCRAMLGANLSMLALIEDLRERYHVDSTVLMPMVKDGDLAEILEQKGFSYYEMPMKPWVISRSAKYKKMRGISAQIKSFFLHQRILRVIKGIKCDLIYSNNSVIQEGALLAHDLKLPHIWHIREFAEDDYDLSFSYPEIIRKKYFTNADVLIAISKSIERYVKDRLCPGSKVKLVYNGIQINKLLRKKWNENGVLQIAYTGALQEGKNQLELLQTANILKKNYSECFHISLIGDGGEYRKLLEEYVREKGLEQQVSFLGYQKDVSKLLDQMDVGVICSRAEGFGRVTCEYMLASMPVVGADNAGTAELIRNGKNGYLYSLGDVNALAEMLESYIIDRKQMCVMGTNAYHYVTEQFSMEKTTDNIYDIMCSVMK